MTNSRLFQFKIRIPKQSKKTIEWIQFKNTSSRKFARQNLRHCMQNILQSSLLKRVSVSRQSDIAVLVYNNNSCSAK